MKDKTTEAGSGALPANPTRSEGRGQKVSRERGTATNHKKNPGKRPTQGGH